MIDNMIIKDITLGNLDTITLKVAMDELKPKLQEAGVKIYKEGKTMHLIVPGQAPVNIDGEEFKAKMRDEIIGKTLGEIKLKKVTYELLTDLNLIQSISLEKNGSNTGSYLI